MTLVALPFAVVSNSTCELVTCVTLTSGAGTGWEGKVYSDTVLSVLGGGGGGGGCVGGIVWWMGGWVDV